MTKSEEYQRLKANSDYLKLSKSYYKWKEQMAKASDRPFEVTETKPKFPDLNLPVTQVEISNDFGKMV